jgi:hypothetical protein
MNNNNAPFYVGQRVVALKELIDIKKGQIYTVAAISQCACGVWHVSVEESKSAFLGVFTCAECGSINEPLSAIPNNGAEAYCFAPIEPRHQDVEIDEAIIEQAQELINTPEKVAPVPTPVAN